MFEVGDYVCKSDDFDLVTLAVINKIEDNKWFRITILISEQISLIGFNAHQLCSGYTKVIFE